MSRTDFVHRVFGGSVQNPSVDPQACGDLSPSPAHAHLESVAEPREMSCAPYRCQIRRDLEIAGGMRSRRRREGNRVATLWPRRLFGLNCEASPGLARRHDRFAACCDSSVCSFYTVGLKSYETEPIPSSPIFRIASRLWTVLQRPSEQRVSSGDTLQRNITHQ
jgi:hypothetical protein